MDEESKEMKFIKEEIDDIKNQLILLVDKWHSGLNKRYIRHLQNQLKVSLEKEYQKCQIFDNSDITEETLSCPVQSFPGIDRRASNALRYSGVSTVGELLKCTEMHLLSFPNMGKKSLYVIKDALADAGLGLSK